MAIRSILRHFAIFWGHLCSIIHGHLVYYSVVVCFTKKNLATLAHGFKDVYDQFRFFSRAASDSGKK
jgi:hypothetical protein